MRPKKNFPRAESAFVKQPIPFFQWSFFVVLLLSYDWICYPYWGCSITYDLALSFWQNCCSCYSSLDFRPFWGQSRVAGSVEMQRLPLGNSDCSDPSPISSFAQVGLVVKLKVSSALVLRLKQLARYNNWQSRGRKKPCFLPCFLPSYWSSLDISRWHFQVQVQFTRFQSWTICEWLGRVTKDGRISVWVRGLECMCRQTVKGL